MNIFQEDIDADGGKTISIQIEGDGPVETIRSPFQVIDIYKTRPFGTMLVLDGMVQLTQYDNFAYHEMIAHVPMFAHPNPRQVLIVGGGDGGTLNQVLKHEGLCEVVLCEIDKDVVAISKKYFPEFAKSFDDPRVTVIHKDAVDYIQERKNYFDVICVDSSDPIGPAVKLFGSQFYHNISEALCDDGIAVAQGESMYYYQDEVVAWCKRNKKIFKHASYYYTVMPTYASGTIGFLYCSKRYGPFECVDTARINKLEGLDYYTQELHKASFQLPAFLKKRLYAD